LVSLHLAIAVACRIVGNHLFAAGVAPTSAAEKPKVRTITAFIRLDTNQYKQQVTDTLTMLRNAKARFELAGYEVQTIRISTQPFPNTRAECQNRPSSRFFTTSIISRSRRLHRRHRPGADVRKG